MDWWQSLICSMCARGKDGARPPTAEESKEVCYPAQAPTFESSAKAGWTAAEDKARRLANKALAGGLTHSGQRGHLEGADRPNVL